MEFALGDIVGHGLNQMAHQAFPESGFAFFKVAFFRSHQDQVLGLKLIRGRLRAVAPAHGIEREHLDSIGLAKQIPADPLRLKCVSACALGEGAPPWIPSAAGPARPPLPQPFQFLMPLEKSRTIPAAAASSYQAFGTTAQRWENGFFVTFQWIQWRPVFPWITCAT
jgi:hypothetical protein